MRFDVLIFLKCANIDCREKGVCGCVGGVDITLAVGLGLLASICLYELSQLPVCKYNSLW